MDKPRESKIPPHACRNPDALYCGVCDGAELTHLRQTNLDFQARYNGACAGIKRRDEQIKIARDGFKYYALDKTGVGHEARTAITRIAALDKRDAAEGDKV